MPGRARVWVATHEISGNGMASVGGNMAGDDWNDFAVAAIEERKVSMSPDASPNGSV